MAFERDRDEMAQANAELRRNQMLDNQLQPDPELAEGPASGGRIALFAIAVIAILGVVFYGLNSSTPPNTANNQPAQTSGTASNMSAPASPNANPGQTTGAAPTMAPAPTPPASSNAPGNNAAGSNAPAGSSSGQ